MRAAAATYALSKWMIVWKVSLRNLKKENYHSSNKNNNNDEELFYFRQSIAIRDFRNINQWGQMFKENIQLLFWA